MKKAIFIFLFFFVVVLQMENSAEAALIEVSGAVTVNLNATLTDLPTVGETTTFRFQFASDVIPNLADPTSIATFEESLLLFEIGKVDVLRLNVNEISFERDGTTDKLAVRSLETSGLSPKSTTFEGTLRTPNFFGTGPFSLNQLLGLQISSFTEPPTVVIVDGFNVFSADFESLEVNVVPGLPSAWLLISALPLLGRPFHQNRPKRQLV